MIRALVLVLAACCSLAIATPAIAAVPPGRVVLDLGSPPKTRSVDPRGMFLGVAHADRRITLAGIDRRRNVVLVRLMPDGSPDPSFGTAGVARISLPVAPDRTGPGLLQLLRSADGNLVLVATVPASRYELDQLVFARATPDGRLDTSFGQGGIVRPGVQGSCGGCAPAALAPDGSIVFTGNTGAVPPAVERDPTVRPDFRWVAGRLTPGGALDRSFGDQGLAALPGSNGGGYGTALVPGDGVAVLGRADDAPKVARLTATGALDPAFNGGAPLTVPGAPDFAFGILGHANGSFDVLATKRTAGEVIRYTPTGAMDPRFGDGGVARVTTGAAGGSVLLPAPDGGTIVAGPLTFNPPFEPVGLRVARVGPDGRVTAQTDVPLRFGGGLATSFARLRVPRVSSIDQNGFRTGQAFARGDGGLIVPGAVAVVEYTGEGTGYLTRRAAVAALTPSLALDSAFGGPQAPARIAVRVARQRAALTTSPRLLRVSVIARTSGPGLARLTVRAGRRVVARSNAAVFRTGEQRLPALLTATGRRVLKHARNLRVTVTATFRDFQGAQARASAGGTLR